MQLTANALASRVDGLVVLSDVTRRNIVPGVMRAAAKSCRNVDARLAGGEASAAATVADRVSLSSSVSYVRGTQDARTDLGGLSTHVAVRPPLAGRAGLRRDDGRLFLELEGSFAGAQTRLDSDLQETATRGRGIANARAGYTSEPGRTVFANLSYRC